MTSPTPSWSFYGRRTELAQMRALLDDWAKYQRKYYSKNKSKVKDRVRRWRAANKEKYNAYMRALRRKKKLDTTIPVS